MGDLSKAKEYIQSALVLDQTLGNWGFTMHELGEVNEAMGDLETAEKNYREALETLEQEINDDRAWVDTQEALGRLALKRGETERASGYYQQVLSTVEVGDDKKREADILAVLAEVEKIRNNLVQATANVLKSLMIYLELNDKINVDRMSSLLAQIGDIVQRREQISAPEKTETIPEETDPFQDLMIHIKGGTFEMGDTFGDGESNEKPIHLVNIPDFQLCKYPVTQAQWKKIMGDNPAHFKGDELPVEQVSWDDAQAFLKKLNAQTGQKYRLPSEAEWEYAAREGGKKVRFGNGKEFADPKDINFNASEKYKKIYSVVGEFRNKTTPVNQFTPNDLGLYDMSGNVWEWCGDWYDEKYYSKSDGVIVNPSGPSSEEFRVLRGGSWYSYPNDCRAAYRNWLNPNNRDLNIGFRVARGY